MKMKAWIKIPIVSFAVSALLAWPIFSINNYNTAQASTASSSGSAFFDLFNDGEIDAHWIQFPSPDSPIYEADGVLNMDVAGGNHQHISVLTKEHFLRGDFDVQVSFRVDPEYHRNPESLDQKNTSLYVEIARDSSENIIDRVMIGIYDHGYHTSEEGVSSGNFYGSSYAWISSEDVNGKFRIKRTGETITTYYWDLGWVKNYKWNPENMSSEDVLRIGLDAYNWDPTYPSFWVKWDNLNARNR